MTGLRNAARQALEALEELNGWQSLAPPLASQAGRQAAINLRAALEQPERWVKSYCGGKPNYTTPTEQEPVANNPDPYHLSRILHELAGSASMCWEHVDRAGVFQSTQAADVVAAAIAEIRQRMKDAPPRRETEPAFDALVAISLLTHLGGEVAEYADVVEAVRRLHALNGELLEALKALCESHSRFSGGVWDKARAAAIRARGNP